MMSAGAVSRSAPIRLLAVSIPATPVLRGDKEAHWLNWFLGADSLTPIHGG